MKRDPVTPAMRQLVFERDRDAIERALRTAREWSWASFQWLGDRLLFGRLVVCPAVLIDPAQLGKCSGRWTIEHVKDEPRLGVRAKSDLAHMVALCEGHCEPGMKAGVIWNTAHRPALRDYLVSVA